VRVEYSNRGPSRWSVLFRAITPDPRGYISSVHQSPCSTFDGFQRYDPTHVSAFSSLCSSTTTLEGYAECTLMAFGLIDHAVSVPQRTRRY
jgi:hypothetical protein